MAGSYQSNDIRKGFTYLVESLKILYDSLPVEFRDRVKVIIVSQTILPEFNEIKFEKIYLDYIHDFRLLSLLYQSASVFVNSSIEDAGPMMVSEALACGTPVVGFEMGVILNMVFNGFNGYKAKLKDSNDLANGIREIIMLDKEKYSFYSHNASLQVIENSSFQYVSNVLTEVLLDD